MTQPNDKFQELIDAALKAGEDAGKAAEDLGAALAHTVLESRAAGKPPPWMRQREYRSWVMRVLEYCVRKARWGRWARWDR